MVDVLLVAVAVLALGTTVLSGQLRRTPLSAPMLGLVTGVALGPALLGVLPVPVLGEVTGTGHEVTRAALAVSVMAVALRYPVRSLRPHVRPLLVLLLVVMPLAAGVTSALAVAVLGLGLGAALLVGTALAPTDPVLAASTVTGDLAESTLPEQDRQVLSLESGSNDGLALPLVLGAVAVAGPLAGTGAVLESCWQVGGACVLGAAAGWAGARGLRVAEDGGTGTPSMLVVTLVLSLGVLGLSGLLDVDGVLAVFVAGLVFNALATSRERGLEQPVDEAVNGVLVLPLFVLLGAALPWSAWAEEGWALPVFVVAVLLLRRVPVVLALHRAIGLARVRDSAYLGWFGPIGVSALFYLSLEAERLPLDDRVLAVGVGRRRRQHARARRDVGTRTGALSARGRGGP